MRCLSPVQCFRFNWLAALNIVRAVIKPNEFLLKRFVVAHFDTSLSLYLRDLSTRLTYSLIQSTELFIQLQDAHDRSLSKS